MKRVLQTARLHSLRFTQFLAFQLLLGVSISITVQAQNEQEIKPSILKSEAPTLRFEHVGIQNGLAQGSANSITQDEQGFIWISTQGGLHRYDGQEFKIYASTPFDTTSLSDNWVWGITEVENGDLWVTTESGGLNRMDRTTEKFTHYRHNPDDSTSISSDRTFSTLEARNGDLWVTTLNNGISRMKATEDGIFKNYKHVHEDPNTISAHTTFAIFEDEAGMIWVTTSNGISRVNPKTDEITRFLSDSLSSEGYGDKANVLGVYKSPTEKEIIWLATGNGLLRFNISDGSNERFLLSPNSDSSTNPLNFLHDVSPDPADPNILWVAGPGAGVARFDYRTGEFTTYRKNESDPNSLIENDVSSLFTDRAGTMWVGYTTEGFSKFNPAAVNFSHLKYSPDNPESIAPGIVWGVYEDQEGSLWIGSDAGVRSNILTRLKSDGTKNKATQFRYNQDDTTSILPGTYRTFAEDAQGNFWIGSSFGLSLLNRKTDQGKWFRQDKFGRDNIFALEPSLLDSNILIIGSGAGLDKFDVRTKEFTPIELTADTSNTGPVVLSLYQNNDGIIWIGTNDGLFKVDTLNQFSLQSSYNPNNFNSINNNNISAIIIRPDEPEIIWIGTQGGGLNRFDAKTGIAKHFTEKEGLSNNTIYGLLLDNSGTLWMSTNNGISNFDPETNTFRNYGLDDGLMALEYDQNAFRKGTGGILYFGSPKGVTAFVPEQLHINETPPQVVLSDFKLFNKSVKVGPDSPLEKSLSETSLITLKYNQNEISFDYVALHFANSAKNQYAYKLEGFDKDWVVVGNKQTATYTNLAAGTYTFHVKASNADDIWNEKGTSIKLTVLPPWYNTWWAYILFAIILGLLIVGIDRLQRHQISIKENERSILREAELRAEAENKRRADTEQLSKIGQAITSTLSVDTVIETVYENVNALMDAAIFGIGIYNKRNHCLDFPATKEKGVMLPAYINQLDEGRRLAAWCFKNNKEIIIGDFEKEQHKYLKEYHQPIEGEESSSVIYLPLVHHKKVIGVLTTQSFSKNAYTEYHVNLLRNLATYAAIAIDNASAYRKLNATLSELKSMQQQLVQQEKLASLGQLTAGIAHEIKNPLNFVTNFSELSVELLQELREEVENVKTSLDSTQQEGSFNEISELMNDIEINLKKIQEHGSRADSIVKSMLQHSRGGTGKKETTDLNALLKEFVNLTFHGMRAAKNPFNVDIELDLDESLTEIPLISEDFSRVVVNLCNNAFDAMREKYNAEPTNYKPKLTVSTKNVSGGIHLTISDNGPGIPDSIKDQILQPFFTTKKGTAGTGLGLSITNDIIKAHGGTLEIETKTNEFTRFNIYLT